jgi:hypothetical protein
MQEKHFVIVHCKEDRDVFINKLNHPKTVYHVGGNPEPGDVSISNKQGIEWIYNTWIVDNYDNLPEYTIFTQAIPDDHVHEPLLAFESTLKSGFGSFAYARSLYNQYTTDWVMCHPCGLLLEILGFKLHNLYNIPKSLFMCYPGVIFFVSREKIREKPKSFYENMIKLHDDEALYEAFEKQEKPDWFYSDITKYHPHLNGLSKEEIFKKRTERLKGSYFGLTCEALWYFIFASEEMFNYLDTAQAALGNKLYFNTKSQNYDPNFRFFVFPFSSSVQETIMNFKLLENDWFDWDCPNYKKWRKTLVEKTIWEGEQRGFDGRQYLNFLEQSGYKHISF